MTRAKTGRRWALAGVWGGAVGSLAANVAHAWIPPDHAPAGWHPSYGAMAWGVVVAAALVTSLGILEQVPWPDGRRWVLIRFGGGMPVAAVAGWTSYRHLSGLLERWGEPTSVIYGGPAIVDGLMVLASGALLALAGDHEVQRTVGRPVRDLRAPHPASVASGRSCIPSASEGAPECATEMQPSASEPSAAAASEVHPSASGVHPGLSAGRVHLTSVGDLHLQDERRPSAPEAGPDTDIERIARDLAEQDQIPSLRALMATHSIGQSTAQKIQKRAKAIKAEADQLPASSPAIND